MKRKIEDIDLDTTEEYDIWEEDFIDDF